MSGVQILGVCYPDQATAEHAFRSLFFPTMPDAAGVSYAYSGGNGFVSWSDGCRLRYFVVRSDTGAVSERAVYFRGCTPDVSQYVFDKYPVQDVLFAAAFLFAAVIGFAMGRRA